MVYKGYRGRSKKRDFSFLLTKEKFKNLTKMNCYYCGAAPTNNMWGYIYNGLDRIDNNNGYFYENVVPCCSRCNTAKLNSNQKEFFVWVEKLYTNLKSKGVYQ